jgi:hypothetical protein
LQASLSGLQLQLQLLNTDIKTNKTNVDLSTAGATHPQKPGQMGTAAASGGGKFSSAKHEGLRSLYHSAR